MHDTDGHGDVAFENGAQHMTAHRQQYDILVDSGIVMPYREGQFVLSERFLRLMDCFDTLLLLWAKRDGAEELMVPEFYHEADLNRCKYMEQFHPQCFFSAGSRGEAMDTDNLTYTGLINNPAVCMHCYILNQDTVIGDQPIRLTVKGRCKRREASGYRSLERLLDFTMREIVLIGSEGFVLQKRREYMKRAEELMLALGLDGNIKTASDPFFKKTDQAKAAFQKRFKLKYEMNLTNYDTGNEIAVGSFNYHHIHFAQAYNIRQADGTPAHSCCMAFGLERLAYTFLSQVGLDNAFPILDRYLRDCRHA